ncbi:MAG: acyl-CoA synthetase [Marivirga sp.]|nr:acyl-CoA synthetase [Marivirga sp.]
MNLYPYDSILLNGRTVEIPDILSGSTYPASEFEKSVFSFITEWLNGVENFIQHTSGSTGTPKAITISRTQMTASAELTERALELKKGYCALVCLSPQYIAGKMMLVRSFVTGMKIVAMEPAANPFKNLPTHQTIDFAALVPYQLRAIVDSDQSKYLDRMSTVIVGGATVDEDIINDLQAYGCNFYATYGMTETISHVALRPLNGSKASENFKTLSGISIELDDRGCLVIKWDKLPDKIITNDLVELTGDDTFRWLGRWDNVINTGGIKVIPEKLESTISKIFATLKLNQRFFVDGLNDEKLGTRVVLFVEGSLNADVSQRLKDIMSDTLPKYEVPRQILTIKSFVFTETDKINRKATINLHLAL